MSLKDFFPKEEIAIKENHRRIELLEKLIEDYKAQGINPKVAKAKAEMRIFTPEELTEKRGLFKNDPYMGDRPFVTFYLDSLEELKMINKFFRLNKFNAVSDSSLLVEMFKKMDTAFEEKEKK